MNILYVNTVPTDGNGITNVIFNLLSAFPNENVNLGFVSINNPPPKYSKWIESLGLKLYTIPRKITHPLDYIFNLRHVAKGYDIMHVHGNSATMVLEMIAAKLAGVKLRIAHSHNTTCEKRVIDKVMRPLFYSLCNGRLACGVEAGQWLFGKRNFKVINNGIKVECFRFNSAARSKIRNLLGINNQFVIGNVGNFLHQKNHDFLLDVFYHINQSLPNSQLILLGGGPLKEELAIKATRLGFINKVIFAGSVDTPADYMSAMDFIVMPSLFEGLPLTLVEEQANGLNCLVSDVITRDVNLTGNVDFLSLDQSAETWGKAVIDFYGKKNSAREETSNDAIIAINSKNYDINAIAEELNKYYITNI